MTKRNREELIESIQNNHAQISVEFVIKLMKLLEASEEHLVSVQGNTELSDELTLYANTLYEEALAFVTEDELNELFCN